MKRRKLLLAGSTSLAAVISGSIYLAKTASPKIFLTADESDAAREYLPANAVKNDAGRSYITLETARELLDHIQTASAVNSNGILLFWND